MQKEITIQRIRIEKVRAFAQNYNTIRQRLSDIGATLEDYIIKYDDEKVLDSDIDEILKDWI